MKAFCGQMLVCRGKVGIGLGQNGLTVDCPKTTHPQLMNQLPQWQGG